MRAKGSNAKYDYETQRLIVKEFLTTDISRPELAEQYSVSVGTIDNYIKKFRKEFEEQKNDKRRQKTNHRKDD